MTLPALAGTTRIHTLPHRPPFMLIREVADVIGMKPKLLEQAFRRNRDTFPERYFFVLTEAEFREQWLQKEATAERRRTDLEQVGLTEKGVMLLLTFVSGKVAVAGRIALIDSLFDRHAQETEALRSALVQDEAAFIGRSTVKAQIKLAALEGWTWARLVGAVSCSQPQLVRHVQAMRVRGYIPADVLLPPAYVLKDMARKADHLDAHEADQRQLLLNWEG